MKFLLDANAWIEDCQGYAPPTFATRLVEPGPLPLRLCYGAGVLLLVPDAAARRERGGSIGPSLAGYWFACVIFAMILQSWLTGQVK